jgi:uncharacterized 2Fe-2S/4Fe-4S cluster protein (DUF4445 family)
MAEKTFKITLLPEGRHMDFPAETPLWEALLDMGLMIKTPCGGRGTCGKCKVVLKYAHSENREEMLACNTLLNNDIEVFTDERYKVPGAGSHLPHPAETAGKSFSFAVDIGTTTVKMSLVDTATGVSYNMPSFLNPQRRFGHDVVSRIAASADTRTRSRMSSLIREAVFINAKDACDSAGINTTEVKEFILSGNTTMISIFFGIDPTPIGHAPYRAPMLDFEDKAAAELGGKVFNNAVISALPARAAYLGSDLVAGITMCREKGLDRNTFFIDLGTNGELFVANGSGKIKATSCAMGPAIEGMNMSCGMTADDGAITHIMPTAYGLTYNMQGEGRPAGMTGTAIIDLVSALISKGAISKSGLIMSSYIPIPGRYFENNGMKEILLWDDIRITQMDIRNLQLAKAASLAASRLLLKKAGIDEDDIENVILAGALGEHLDIESFKSLGFVPGFKNAAWNFIGNTSLKAAENACMDKLFAERARKLRDATEEIVLTEDPTFQKVFIESVDFPQREV